MSLIDLMVWGAILAGPSYLAYAVTFLFIGQVWANHHADQGREPATRTMKTEVDLFTPHDAGGPPVALRRGASPCSSMVA